MIGQVGNHLTCPHCGGAITALVGANPDANAGAITAQIPDATAAQNGQIAQMVLGSKTATKDGRQAYNQGYPESFEVFWKVYPLRKSKRKSLIAWRNAIRRIGANPVDAMAQILEGAKRLRADPNRVDEFTPYGATWLNADGWLDEPLPARGGPRDRAAEILRGAAAKEASRGSLPG